MMAVGYRYREEPLNYRGDRLGSFVHHKKQKLNLG